MTGREKSRWVGWLESMTVPEVISYHRVLPGRKTRDSVAAWESTGAAKRAGPVFCI